MKKGKVKSEPKYRNLRKSLDKLSFQESKSYVKTNWKFVALILTLVFLVINVIYNVARGGYNITSSTVISVSSYQNLPASEKIKYKYERDFTGKESYEKTDSRFSIFYMLFSIFLSFIINLIVWMLILFLISRFL